MSNKIKSVNAEAAKEMVSRAGRRIARTVSRKAASQGSVVKEKLAAGSRVAMAKIASAGVKLTQKQLGALEKAKSKYSGSGSDSGSDSDQDS